MLTSHGSPPRMRGKLFLLRFLLDTHGITPAHAGKTASPKRQPPKQRDHPRACGENSRIKRLFASLKGSPPRMRGKQNSRYMHRSNLGITPAHAGKTYFLSQFLRLNRDHPRACGENTNLETFSGNKKGSPPRMRGKRSQRNYLRSRIGITPAHAGKTDAARPAVKNHRDHPRACGENCT